MPDLELMSVDWDSVRLMQAGQFTQETHYLEELVRWTLLRGRVAGLLSLTRDGVSRPSPEGSQHYSVSVHGCVAVGRHGEIIEIADDPRRAVTGTIEALSQTVPLYIGVSRVARSMEPELHSSVDQGLIGCGGRRRLYRLAADDRDDKFDWFQIAQFEKTPSGLKADPLFLPECMFLSSHPNVAEARREITTLGRTGLDVLAQNSSASVHRYSAAVALAASLGAAAYAVDDRLSPRAFLDRLAGVFAAQGAQLRALPPPNLRLYQDTLDTIEETLAYFRQDASTLGQAFARACECLERLVQLYPPLLKSLEAAAPAQSDGTWTTKRSPRPRPHVRWTMTTHLHRDRRSQAGTSCGASDVGPGGENGVTSVFRYSPGRLYPWPPGYNRNNFQIGSEQDTLRQ